MSASVHYEDPHLTVWLGDAREALAAMPAESVNCVVTSPPYWGLRDYGIPPSVWGDRSDPPTHVHEWTEQAKRVEQGSCACGAWLGCLGLEPTPEMFVEHLVEVFREVRRVLRKDGTVFLNMGDSYATGAGAVGSRPGGGAQGDNWHGATTSPNRMPIAGLKPKDRVMIPARVALALQADGWWLRDEIVWAKSNPMPSSVRDRTTPAHEMVYLLTKSARYHYDGAAIAEPMAGSSIARINQPNFDAQSGGPKDYANGTNPNQSARKALENVARAHRRTPAGWNVNHDKPNNLGRYEQRAPATYREAQLPGSVSDSTERQRVGLNARWDESEAKGTAPLTRNKRSVWTVATQPYPEAHFATFPEALIEPMILAGCPALVCATCGTAVDSHDAVRLQSVRSGILGVPVADGPNPLLQSGVRHDREAPAGPGLRGVRPPVGQESVLRADVREPGDSADQADDNGADPHGQGLHRPLPPGPPDGHENGLRAGASSRNGRGARPDAVADRSRRPHQHGQGRQQAGEPAGHDEEGPRRSLEPRPDQDGDLPGLREPLPVTWPCRQCGADLAAAGGSRRGVVLDCFGGSGTVAVVAQRLGRRAVLVDLSPEYVEQMIRRVAAARGAGKGPAVDMPVPFAADGLWSAS